MKHLSRDIISLIIADFNGWKNVERTLIATEDYDSSVLYALGSFNFASLNTDTGMRVMKDILNPTNEIQGTASRFKRFVSSCMLKYGIDMVEEYKAMCYTIMKKVYGISDSRLLELERINDCAWVCIMFTIG